MSLGLTRMASILTSSADICDVSPSNLSALWQIADMTCCLRRMKFPRSQCDLLINWFEFEVVFCLWQREGYTSLHAVYFWGKISLVPGRELQSHAFLAPRLPLLFESQTYQPPTSG